MGFSRGPNRRPCALDVHLGSPGKLAMTIRFLRRGQVRRNKNTGKKIKKRQENKQKVENKKKTEKQKKEIEKQKKRWGNKKKHRETKKI